MSLLASFFAPDALTLEAQSLYREIVAQSRNPVWYAEYAVPDTPQGRFEMICLHMAGQLVRYRGEEHTALRQRVIETMITDLDRSLREMGVGDMGVGRRVKRFISGAYERFGAYGAAWGERENLARQVQHYVFEGDGSTQAECRGIAALIMEKQEKAKALPELREPAIPD